MLISILFIYFNIYIYIFWGWLLEIWENDSSYTTKYIIYCRNKNKNKSNKI